MRHIISVLLENESGALSRVSGLFSARGYNIESLTVAPTNDPTLSRMTIVTVGDDRKIDQIEKQLNKLVDVAALEDITVSGHLEREVILAKVVVTPEQKTDLDRVVAAFNGSLIDVSASQSIIEMSGSSEKIDELLNSLSGVQIIEIARSGVTGLSSSEGALTV
ncbi:acetolactate synthase small subunit [Arenicella chitinivorans]|uniref:Acetolactate synthase small subunit n=1 Tax=Arenicella chitinivorans TaxID=1329800 RepID=A0A918RJU0_9GAMM|nr:acetolactate synthase small subunit [Arenicella chitinivorans]GHA00799.1 acetolactate synthase small subunit [Arenicella chitinivorans]